MDTLSSSSFLSLPEHFGTVVDHVYRSETPHPVHFAFLKTLKLKTILHCTPERPSKSFMTFVEDEGIEWVHLGARNGLRTTAMSGGMVVLQELVKSALELILDKRKEPLLIMDQSGLHESGVVVGCLRRMMHWNFTSIVVEYRSFAAALSRYHELELIELFDTDSVTRPQPQDQAGWWAALEAAWQAEDAGSAAA